MAPKDLATAAARDAVDRLHAKLSTERNSNIADRMIRADNATVLQNRNSWIPAAVALLCTIGMAQSGTTAISGNDAGPTSPYLEHGFLSVIGEVPRLGWVLPDSTLVTSENGETITVLSSMPTISQAHLRAEIPFNDRDDFVLKHHVACEVVSTGAPFRLFLYESAVRPNGRNPQVFYTHKSLPGGVAGYSEIPIPPSGRAQVWKRMRPKSRTQLRKAFAVGRQGAPHSYSFAALYDGPQREMTRKGMFLHASDGRVIASKIYDINGFVCDGCAVPTYKQRLQDETPVINFFTFPHFQYPVLMLDTSTFEGRASSLVTFSPDGEQSEYRLYEYVIHCW